MNKPLPSLPKHDDLVDFLIALSLAGKEDNAKNSTHPPVTQPVSSFIGGFTPALAPEPAHDIATFHARPTPAVYCRVHQKDMITVTGFYPRRPGRPDRFVNFNDYIPKYLQADTQARLRQHMAKPPSSDDEPGYIYAFEIRDSKRPDVIQIKVGRATALNRRLHQWSKACGSQEQILRGWWPRTVESDDVDASLVTGNIEPSRSGLFSYHVERLVHLELADLSVHVPYLEPDWPHSNKSDESLSAASNVIASPRTKVSAKPCTGCGTVHKEIFTFQRPKGGQYKEMEWQLIVKPVIKKWVKFMEEYYA
ncbi:hypothetical protein BU15DRAFT_59575 [Melanogaster broomeanus]|nr:hypothetical protein BU15DRAFT_59575 [Melanogaster broomeanus]